MRIKILIFLACLMRSTLLLAFADEDSDWGIASTTEIRQGSYSAQTPMRAPGAKTVQTKELHDILVHNPSPILIDVAGGDGHLTLRGAYWLPGVGRGAHFFDPLQAELLDYLERLTAGDKSRPIVFFCVNARCWLSYNSSLRAVALGYKNVLWYRGGIEAWSEAGLPMASTERPKLPSQSIPATP